MRESVIEAEVVKYAKEQGWLVRKIKYIGRVGAKDRLFIKNGVVLFLEFKSTTGALRPTQVRELKKFRDHGAKAFIIPCITHGINILDNYS
jgi:hypothetical protein